MARLGREEEQAVLKVLRSGELCRYGPAESTVAAFEKGVREKFGVKHALATNGGTASLIVALYAAGVGLGDEVIISGYTWIATPSAVVIANAVPIIAEIDESLSIDPDDIEAKITPRTKAIIPVHMLGMPSDMPRIKALAEKYNLVVIEDCAQAMGASVNGKRVGTYGDIGCFSLQQSKILITGEGGVVMTDDENLYDRVRMTHDAGNLWGISKQSAAAFPGMNFRMDEIRGAVASVQLTRLDDFLENTRIRNAKLCEAIADVDGIEMRKLHDENGDCNLTVAFFLPTPDLAVKFGEAMGKYGAPGGPMYTHGNGDRHVYSNWHYILEKKTYHPNGLPYSHPAYEGKIHYSDRMCPRTLDYLSRAIRVSIQPDMTDEAIDKTANAIRLAARDVL